MSIQFHIKPDITLNPVNNELLKILIPTKKCLYIFGFDYSKAFLLISFDKIIGGNIREEIKRPI